MKVGIVGNMANNGYNNAKALRGAGIEADLILPSYQLNLFSSVEWEEGVFGPEMDSKSFNFKMVLEAEKLWNRPQWVKYYDTKDWFRGSFKPFARLLRGLELYDFINEYDVLELHVPFPYMSSFLKMPTIVYDAGWARYFPRGNTFFDHLASMGYARSDRILITNIDMWRIFDSLEYIDKNKISYMPFSIDYQKYKPIDMSDLRRTLVKENEILLFQPSRQVWSEKGNDKVFKAFKKLLGEHQNVILLAAEWGRDIEKSKSLIHELGIVDRVLWFKPVPKPKLIQYINSADIILDQFSEPSYENQIWGPWGTAALEAMSCGKPLLLYYDKEGVIRFVGEKPFALHSLTVDDIYKNLKLLIENPSLREEIGKKSREWIIKMHGPQVIAKKYLEIFHSLL